MKTRCEGQGVCNAMNCQSCKLAREQKQAKRDEAQTLAKAALAFGIKLTKGEK